MRKLVLASGNKGKISELRELLIGLPVEVVGLDSYPQAPKVAETGQTFAENAKLKAAAIAKYSKELTLADDSGLEVDFLNGEPGVYSARYGEVGWNDRQRYEHLLENLNGVSEGLRTARFRSVVVVCDPLSNQWEQADGTVEGVILAQPRGSNGFGYDPVFYIPEYQLTMAELSADQKNGISHRARAVKRIIPQIQRLLG